MTSTTGADSHPEVAEISALTEGILPPGRSAEIREHLADCALCADVRDSLEEIRELLGTLPGPQRMPADIAGRIDAALAAEALLDSTRPDVPRGTRGTPPAATHVPRGTSTAPGGRPDGSSGPGRSAAPRQNRRRWTRGVLATAAAAAVLVLGGIAFQAVSGSGSGSSNSDVASSAKRNSAEDTDPVALAVRQLLHEQSTGTVNTPMLGGGQETGGDRTPRTPKRGPVVVPDCVVKATQRSDPPLAAGRRPFQGRDAYLLVLPDPGDRSSVDAFVVGASCTATSPGAVLFQRTYPR